MAQGLGDMEGRCVEVGGLNWDDRDVGKRMATKSLEGGRKGRG
jgi:hypothetical protein